MLEFFTSIGQYLLSIGQLIVSLISDLITSVLFLYQSLAYFNSLLFLIPGSILIFGVIYLSIFIFNRLSLGSNK